MKNCTQHNNDYVVLKSMPQSSHLYYPKTLCGAPAYIFGGVTEDSDLVFVPDFTLQPRSMFHKILKFLFVGRLPLPGRLVELLTGYKGYAWIQSLKLGDRLLLNGVTNLRTLQAVAWLAPSGVRLYQYFNNSLQFVYPKHKVAVKTAKMKSMGYHLVTFDPQEALEYGMQYAEQFYRYPSERSDSINYDFFFCGEKKDRGQRLEDLEKKLTQMGFRCLFIVIGRDDKPISYRQYLDYMLQSRCIVDILQQQQKGITRRPVEALFWGKKLLTEHTEIATYDFYRQENILIFKYEQLSKQVISSFINQPSVAIPKEVMDKYEVNHWLNYFK